MSLNAARPSDAASRITSIDALRGAALFGVLLINMLWFAGYENAVTSHQFAALSTAGVDAIFENLVDLFVYAKSIGIFAFLFGVGFALQMDRLESQGAPGRSLYSRRLAGLLLIGFLHWLLVWSGDILHVYALAGFLLLLVYRWPTRWLVAVGLPLAVLARPAFGYWHGATTPDASDADTAYRLLVFRGAGFWSYVRLQFFADCLPDFTNGALPAAVLHAFGRFMLGMAVARGRYLQEAHRYVRPLLLVAIAGVLGGFVLQHDWKVTDWLASTHWVTSRAHLRFAGHAVNSSGVVLMTAGYVAAFALLWQLARARRFLGLFGPLGQMALTNYLLQSLINYVVFFGIGFALIGRVGMTFCVGLTCVIIAIQIALSRWWLGRYRFGPAEWLWRWWTYGIRPALRRADEVSLAQKPDDLATRATGELVPSKRRAP